MRTGIVPKEDRDRPQRRPKSPERSPLESRRCKKSVAIAVGMNAVYYSTFSYSDNAPFSDSHKTVSLFDLFRYLDIG